MSEHPVLAAFAVAGLLLAGCSSAATPTDPNVIACQAWHTAHQTMDDSLSHYAGSGDDPTVDAAIAGEKQVIADQLPKTTAEIHTTMALLQQQFALLAGSDGNDFATAESTMQIACENIHAL